MPEQWKTIWKKYHKKILMALGCICLCAVIGGIMTSAKIMQAAFDPDAYADDNENSENTVDYDSNVFGTEQSEDNGLEMDQKSEDEYNLDSGNNNILDNQDDGNSQGIQVADGSGTGDGNSNAYGLTNDGTGLTIPGTSNTGDNTSGSDSENGSGIDNNNTNNGTENGDSNNPNSGNTGDQDDSGDDNQDDNNDPDTPDPDADKYGTDYNNQETISSSYPTETEDENNGLKVASLKVASGSLKQHFYEGEAPRSEEMSDYISVTATMSDGSVRKNLKYCPTEKSGGDYTVSWGGNEKNQETNKIGYPVAGKTTGTYTATLSYRGMTCKVPYDVVHWQITLKDFDESAQADTIGYEAFSSVLSPSDSPIINLFDSMQNMYNLVGTRTEFNKYGFSEYQHVNIMYETDDPWSPLANCCEQYFGGWTDSQEKISVGNYYKMKRPTEKQIQDGVYNVEMDPLWMDNTGDSDYQIGLYGDATWGDGWYTRLLGYSGTDSTMTVPQGVDEVNIYYLNSFAQDTGAPSPNTTVTKIILPESVSEYSNLMMEGFINFFQNLQEIEVSIDNQTFMSIDGILYNKTGKVLLSVPSAKKSIAKWSKTVQQINANAFQHVQMEQVSVPASVSTCNAYSFFNAAIQTLTLNCTEQMRISMSTFDYDCYVMDSGLQKIILKANALVWTNDSAANLFQNINGNGQDIRTLGLQIQVPDSKNHEVYLEALRFLQKGVDAYNNTTDSAYTILTTPNHAEREYCMEGGFLLSKNKKNLIAASTLLSGDIEIPDCVETITSKAFDGCSNIKSLEVPGSVKKIETDAFANGAGLSALYMQGENPPALGKLIFGENLRSGFKVYVSDTAYDSYLEKETTILDSGYGAGTAKKLFAILPNISKTVINDGNIYIDNENGTYSLYKVRDTFAGIFTPMEGTVTFLEGCFADCTQLNGVVIPQTVVSMEGNLFSGCDSLILIAANSITAPQTAETAFAQLDRGNIRLYLPETEGIEDEYQNKNWSGFATQEISTEYQGVNDSSDNAVLYGIQESDETSHKAIKAAINSPNTLVLKNSTTEICEDAFRGTDITSISNARSVELVGESAFQDCSQLVGIELNSSLWGAQITLEARAFKNCISLSNLTYASASNWSTTIPASVTSLPEECFSGCTALTGVDFLLNLTSIGKECFAGCTGIGTVTFAENIEELGESCFQGCTSLVDVISTNPEDFFTYYSMPYKLKEIPDYCFEGCVSLGQTWLQSEVTRVGDYAFANCQSLPYMAFPMGFTTLGVGSFQNCSAMEEIYADNPQDGLTYYSLPYMLSEVPEHCFEGCTSLARAEMQEATTKVGDYAFAECSSAEYIAFPAALTALGDSSFLNCSNVSVLVATNPEDGQEYYSLPYNITEVPAHCFEGCSNLDMARVREGVTTIGEKAFYGCSSLCNGVVEELYELPSSLKTIGTEAFGNCTSLINVTVPAVLDSLGTGAFNGAISMTSIVFDAAPKNITDTTDVAKLKELYFKDCPLTVLRMGDQDLLVAIESLLPSQSAENSDISTSEDSVPEEEETVADGSIPEEEIVTDDSMVTELPSEEQTSETGVAKKIYNKERGL